MLWMLTALLAALSDATRDLFGKLSLKKVNEYGVTWSFMTLTAVFSIPLLFLFGIPELGELFFPALIGNSIILPLTFLIYMKAIKSSPLSLTLPMLSFTPVFLLLTGFLILGELPSLTGIFGVILIVIGAYTLGLKHMKKGFLMPFKSLLRERGTLLMLCVAFLFSFTATLVKLVVLNSSVIFTIFSTYTLSSIFLGTILFFMKKIKFKEIKTNIKGLSIIGFFMLLSEIAIFYSLTLTLAVFAVAIKRLSILFGSIYGFIFFKEKEIKIRLIAGIIMITGVIMLTIF